MYLSTPYSLAQNQPPLSNDLQILSACPGRSCVVTWRKCKNGVRGTGIMPVKNLARRVKRIRCNLFVLRILVNPRSPCWGQREYARTQPPAAAFAGRRKKLLPGRIFRRFPSKNHAFRASSLETMPPHAQLSFKVASYVTPRVASACLQLRRSLHHHDLGSDNVGGPVGRYFEKGCHEN